MPSFLCSLHERRGWQGIEEGTDQRITKCGHKQDDVMDYKREKTFQNMTCEGLSEEVTYK